MGFKISSHAYIQARRIKDGRERSMIGNANKEEKIGRKKFWTMRLVDRQNAPLPPRERDGLEDAMDRGALDKRGWYGVNRRVHTHRASKPLDYIIHAYPQSPPSDPEKGESMNSEIRRGPPSVVRNAKGGFIIQQVLTRRDILVRINIESSYMADVILIFKFYLLLMHSKHY